jgi:tetratricopeptide (TPR) repeat protein
LLRSSISTLPADNLKRLIAAAAEAQAASDYLTLERLSRELIEAAESGGDRARLAWGYYYLGSACFQRNDGSSAERALRRSLELFEQLGDDYGRARAMCSFGAVVLDVHHDYDQARHWYDGAIPLIRRSGDRHRLAVALGNLGEICRSEGHTKRALEHASEALEIFKALVDHTEAGWQLADIAHYHAIRRDVAAAVESLRDAYAELCVERNPRWIAWYFDIWFIVASQLERWDAAAQLLGFIEHYRDVNKTPRMQALLPWLSQPIEELARRMRNDARLDELRVAGQSLTLEEAQALTEQIR